MAWIILWKFSFLFFSIFLRYLLRFGHIFLFLFVPERAALFQWCAFRFMDSNFKRIYEFCSSSISCVEFMWHETKDKTREPTCTAVCLTRCLFPFLIIIFFFFSFLFLISPPNIAQCTTTRNIFARLKLCTGNKNAAVASQSRNDYRKFHFH